MQGCSGFLQLRLILGITVGITIMGQHVMAAAPLCAEVLKVPSASFLQTDIDRTIENIAHLRLELDLEKSSGISNSHVPFGMTESLYQKKYHELISSLKGTHSEAKVRKLISEKIVQLQTETKKTSQIEKEVRSSQEKIPYRTPFERTDRIVLDRRLLKGAEDAIEFIPKINSLLLSTETTGSGYDKSISLLNLKTHEQTILWQTGESNLVTTKYSSNRNFFTALATGKDLKGEFFFYDVQNATHRMIKIPDEVAYEPNGKILGLDINPNGTSILLILSNSIGTNKRAFLIDTQTNQATALKELATQVRAARQIQFISQDEFVFLEQRDNGTRSLGLHNLRTHIGTKILPGLNFTSLHISRELDHLLLTTMDVSIIANRQIGTLAVAYLNNAEANFINSANEVGEHVINIKALPNYGVFIRRYVSTTTNEIMLALPDSLIVPSITLQDPGGDVRFADMTIDPATQRLFLHSQSIGEAEFYLDIWTPTKPKP